MNNEIFATDPDAPLEWNDIELVIVPAQHDVICPICLDWPVTPRLTKCGHFFCWPCILQYAAANSGAGSGNWRKCPICFESISVKQLKSVFFSQVQDYSTGGAGELVIPMTLLKGSLADHRAKPCNLEPLDEIVSLPQLSPFERISFVGREFVLTNVIEREAKELNDKLAMMDDSAEDRIFVELAISMVSDRRQVLASEAAFPSPPIMNNIPKRNPALPSSPNSTHFFHQASDGQPYFLCPLSIKMLKEHFGTYQAFPVNLAAIAVEIEMAVMTEELRKRYRYLNHLPLGCQFGLCEVDLTDIVSERVLKNFEGELTARAKNRKQKAHKEERLAAEAEKKALLSELSIHDESCSWRSSSPVQPGVATGIFLQNDYENFPFPPGSEVFSDSNSHLNYNAKANPQSTSSIPIKVAQAPTCKPAAGSFASIAASSFPSDGHNFTIIPIASSSSSNAFELSFDEISLPSTNTSDSASERTSSAPISASTAAASITIGTRKGKRLLLVSNVHRRRS